MENQATPLTRIDRLIHASKLRQEAEARDRRKRLGIGEFTDFRALGDAGLYSAGVRSSDFSGIPDLSPRELWCELMSLDRALDALFVRLEGATRYLKLT